MTIYIANINFESELAGLSRKSPLEDQLQFLPLLWCEENDWVWVNAVPEGYFDRWTLEPKNLPVKSWGWSLQVAELCKKHGLEYEMPAWEVVRTVNSKVWSYVNSPQLKGSTLLSNELELDKWLGNLKGKGVVKTAFGLSGRGHCFTDQENLLQVCKNEWSQGRPVIAEPWVDRVLDFSTQWQIHRDGSFDFIASTLLENNAKGSYQSTVIGKEIPGIEEHLVEAKRVLEKIAQLGYFGPVGLDAMFYRQGSEVLLHPIVEINARMTMGLAAYKYRSKYYPTKTLKFYYGDAGDGLLPKKIQNKASFKRQLYTTIID